MLEANGASICWALAHPCWTLKGTRHRRVPGAVVGSSRHRRAPDIPTGDWTGTVGQQQWVAGTTRPWALGIPIR